MEQFSFETLFPFLFSRPLGNFNQINHDQAEMEFLPPNIHVRLYVSRLVQQCLSLSIYSIPHADFFTIKGAVVA